MSEHRTAVITGASSGIGADLAARDSIAAAAAELVERGPIDLFYNNAGVLLAGLEKSKHGIEMHAQVNTIAPYLFGRLLQPALEGATVLTVSTGAVSNTGDLRVAELADPPSFKKLVGPYGPDTQLVLLDAGQGRRQALRGGDRPGVRCPQRSLHQQRQVQSVAGQCNRTRRAGRIARLVSQRHRRLTNCLIVNGQHLAGGRTMRRGEPALPLPESSKVSLWPQQQA